MKPIDFWTWAKQPVCEHCLSNLQTMDGIAIIRCNHPGIYLHDTFMGACLVAGPNESCTPEDWAVCPLNPGAKGGQCGKGS